MYTDTIGSIKGHTQMLLLYSTTFSRPSYLHIEDSLATGPCSLTVSLCGIAPSCGVARWSGVTVVMMMMMTTMMGC